MRNYLLELYLPRPDSLPAATHDARWVKRLGGLGDPRLRYVRTYFIAEDETCFHTFEACCREALVEASRRAGLEDARVTEAVENEEPATAETRLQAITEGRS